MHLQSLQRCVYRKKIRMKSSAKYVLKLNQTISNTWWSDKIRQNKNEENCPCSLQNQNYKVLKNGINIQNFTNLSFGKWNKKNEMIMKFWEPRYQNGQKDTCPPLLVCFLAWAISSNSLSVRLFQSNQVSWSWIDLDWARQNFINMGEWDQHQTNFPLFFSRFDKELEDMTMIHYQSWSHTFFLVPFLKLGFIDKPWESMLMQYLNTPIISISHQWWWYIQWYNVNEKKCTIFGLLLAWR